MKSVLISIQPPHTDNIFDNLKGIEWRTRPLPTGKHHCYETKNGGGCGKVIGEFSIWRVKRYENASRIPETEIDLGCVPKEFLMEYSKGKPIYANYIARPIKYDKPRELWEFKTKCKEYGSDNPNCTECHYYIDGMCYEYDESDCGCSGRKPLKRPPQSWCYVESEDEE